MCLLLKFDLKNRLLLLLLIDTLLIEMIITIIFKYLGLNRNEINSSNKISTFELKSSFETPINFWVIATMHLYWGALVGAQVGRADGCREGAALGRGVGFGGGGGGL